MSPGDASGNTPLSAGVEFDRIRAMVAGWGTLASGIGDDAADIVIPRGERAIVSVDAFVEGRHFRRDWISAREVGYRAVTAALSDLAAMAASPVALLLAISLPQAWRDALDDIATGAGDAVRAGGGVIAGGNLTAASELSLTTTVIGSAFAPLARSGAIAGQQVYVTGRLGGPSSAIRAWQAGRTPQPGHRERFATPAARIREARWLAAAGATSAIDISDGLIADAGHVSVASAVRLEIDADLVPVLDGATREDALGGGEEYELVVTAPVLDAGAFASRFGIPLTAVGVVAPGRGVITTSGGVVVAAPRGHDHFSE